MAAEKPTPESNAPTGKELPPVPPGPIIFVIGPPGSGKGKLCNRVCQQIPHDFRHLSVGDYLRELCSNTSKNEALSKVDSQLSRENIEKYVQESKLLPPDTIIQLLKQKLLHEITPPSRGWLIDGFPRDIETARAFEKEFTAPLRVIVLHCDLRIAKDRFVKRQRSITDDKDVFEKRLKEYDEKIEPIFYHYRDIIINVHTNGTKDESWGSLVQAVRGLPELEGLRMFG